ncbi:hypothetical protein ACFYZ5_40780 [Streptomyces chartreusis]|uniref:hypothetical protein n=1 Tax=Streptomyces chartreusis TaxID=1969 RepID=UPI0036CB8A6F
MSSARRLAGRFAAEISALCLVGRSHLGRWSPDGREGLAQVVGARSMADQLAVVGGEAFGHALEAALADGGPEVLGPGGRGSVEAWVVVFASARAATCLMFRRTMAVLTWGFPAQGSPSEVSPV